MKLVRDPMYNGPVHRVLARPIVTP